MEDLAERINSLLSDPESLKQLGELAQSLGLPAPDIPENPGKNTGNEPDAAMLMSLANALGQSNKNDDNINFLMALKPLLSDEKKPRVDRAVKILRLMNMLPALRESGILGGDFFAAEP